MIGVDARNGDGPARLKAVTFFLCCVFYLLRDTKSPLWKGQNSIFYLDGADQSIAWK